jgi:Zn-dependent peptidase ImmA (M78 family)
MFRRGFKTWAEETSLGFRRRLGVPPHSPANVQQLVELLGIPVITPRELAELDEEVCGRLLSDHSDSWSAITVSADNRHLVVTNPQHKVTRRNSSLAHEVAHIILGHDPSMMFITPASGVALRTHNREQEEEANWLAACLLLPREALFEIRRQRMATEQACTLYGVSAAMLRFRFNASGVDVQLQRARRHRRV